MNKKIKALKVNIPTSLDEQKQVRDDLCILGAMLLMLEKDKRVSKKRLKPIKNLLARIDKAHEKIWGDIITELKKWEQK